MIIEINDKYDAEKIKKILKDNKIYYKDISNIVYDLSLRDDVDNILDYYYDDEEDFEKLSEKDIEDIYDYVIDGLMEYDYSAYNEYIVECIDEWLIKRKEQEHE